MNAFEHQQSNIPFISAIAGDSKKNVPINERGNGFRCSNAFHTVNKKIDLRYRI